MRYRFAIFFVLISSFGRGQRCKLSLEVQPNYSVFNISYPSSYHYIHEKFKSRIGFEAGLRFRYSLSRRLSAYGGAGFTKYNYFGRYQDALYNQLVSKKGFTLPQSENKYNYSFNYLGLPLGVYYAITKKLSVGAGIKGLALLSAYTWSIYYYYDADRKNQNNFDKKEFLNKTGNKWPVNAMAEIVYTIPVFKKQVGWKAAFECALTDYFVNKYPGNLYPYTFSLGVSVPVCRWGK